MRSIYISVVRRFCRCRRNCFCALFVGEDLTGEASMKRLSILSAAAMSLMASSVTAQTDITWWHAMGGALGDTVNQIATDFNASQTEYQITPVFKGTYEEALTAGIAAFRAGEQPNILQVFDAGAATVIGAKVRRSLCRIC